MREEILCITRQGRPVPRLHVGCLTGEPQHRVVLTARHHCCEMMASYAIEGVIEAMLADDDNGQWLRANVEAAILPFMDRDGVEAGDQGKNRRPHDHNRDYGADSVHLETRALRDFVTGWSDGRLALMVDLHCPWIRGDHNEHIYQVGCERPECWAQQQAFGTVLERVATGPLPYGAAGDLAYGQSWNAAGNYGALLSAMQWFARFPGIRLATAIEIPYANSSGCAVTAASARAFGCDLAEALCRYLQQGG